MDVCDKLDRAAVLTNNAETRLLFACARMELPVSEVEVIRELIPFASWEQFIELANHHNVLGLAYRHLTQYGRELIPTEALQKMRYLVEQDLASNLHLTQELLRLLGLFESVGLAVIPFKGPCLTASIYGNLSVRRFADLDLFIRPEDFTRVKQVLVSEGYLPDPDLTPGQERLLLIRYNELPFRHPNSKIMVDVQWRLRPAYAGELDYVGFWQRQIRIPLAGALVPAFSSEDLLLVLCIHAEKHAWSHLELVCGVNELIRNASRMDWELLLAHAARWRVGRRLRIGLSLAFDLFSCPLPHQVMDSIQRDHVSAKLCWAVKTRLLADGMAVGSNPRILWWQLKTREGMTDKLRFITGSLLMPTVMDWTTIRLPDSLLPLHALLRPMRLLWKLVSRLGVKDNAREIRTQPQEP